MGKFVSTKGIFLNWFYVHVPVEYTDPGDLVLHLTHCVQVKHRATEEYHTAVLEQGVGRSLIGRKRKEQTSILVQELGEVKGEFQYNK